MSMTLPKLDDVTWEQLNEEARALIPAHAPDWTNFNPSDPGITLLELLAYFSESLLYRANRIGDAQTLLFLRLLNGPGWQPSKSLDEDRHATLVALAKPRRAVTSADFEALAIASARSSTKSKSSPAGASQVARAKCISNRNLEQTDAARYNASTPGHFSVIVVPHQGSAPSKSLLQRVKQSLDAAKLIATRVHVVPPIFLKFGIRVTIIKQSRASIDSVRIAAINRLQDFFDPLRGGSDQKGWPFGRDVYISELYRLLGQIPGVDYVTRSKDPDSGEELEEFVVDASEEDRLRYNDDELQSVEVHEEELVELRMSPEDLVIQGGGGHE